MAGDDEAEETLRAWREWFRANGGDFWDKVRDPEAFLRAERGGFSPQPCPRCRGVLVDIPVGDDHHLHRLRFALDNRWCLTFDGDAAIHCCGVPASPP